MELLFWKSKRNLAVSKLGAKHLWFYLEVCYRLAQTSHQNMNIGRCCQTCCIPLHFGKDLEYTHLGKYVILGKLQNNLNCIFLAENWKLEVLNSIRQLAFLKTLEFNQSTSVFPFSKLQEGKSQDFTLWYATSWPRPTIETWALEVAAKPAANSSILTRIWSTYIWESMQQINHRMTTTSTSGRRWNFEDDSNDSMKLLSQTLAVGLVHHYLLCSHLYFLF